MYTDGIIFDVDGTLWDSTPIVAEAWTQAVLECGIKDRIVTAGELKQLFGKTMSVIAESLFPEASKEVQETILEKCCVYEEEALEENQQDICYPDVREVIKQLAKSEIALFSTILPSFIAKIFPSVKIKCTSLYSNPILSASLFISVCLTLRFNSA